jgi:hypothetical protein
MSQERKKIDDVCVSQFSITVTKYLQQSIYKEEGFILAQDFKASVPGHLAL